MNVDGSCYCGFVTFEADIDESTAGVCHCTDCQQMTGSAFRTVVFTVPDGFRLLSGEPTIFEKTAQSGARRAAAFCPKCGSPIWSGAVEQRKVHVLRCGTLRQRDQLTPRRQYWTRSALPWLEGLSQVPKLEQQ